MTASTMVITVGNFKPLPKGGHSFTVLVPDVGIFPGFRVFGGNIIPPQIKVKGAWYCVFYLMPDFAEQLYAQVRANAPRGVVLNDMDTALKGSILTVGLMDRLGVGLE